MISAEGVTKSYPTGWLGRGRPLQVLRGFDFVARAGEVTGLLGRNGSGKTTFFRGLTGLDPFDAGRVTIDGVDPCRHPEQIRSRIALLSEEPGVEPALSGRQHLELFGTLHGLPMARIRVRLAEANAHLAMEDFWDRPFRGYSRGQKARIALCRLRLVETAQVLIFDEPSNGLDFEATARLHRFIRLLAQEGRTILVSSHILNDLRVLCDRLVGLIDGVAATPTQVAQWMQAHADFQRSSETDHAP